MKVFGVGGGWSLNMEKRWSDVEEGWRRSEERSVEMEGGWNFKKMKEKLWVKEVGRRMISHWCKILGWKFSQVSFLFVALGNATLRVYGLRVLAN